MESKKKPGRPRADYDNRLAKHLGTRVSWEEYTAIQDKAKEANMSEAAYLRWVLRTYVLHEKGAD